MALRTLSLFSGAGGLDLGLALARPDAHVVGYVENDAAAVDVLMARMRDGVLERAPVWPDVRSLVPGSVDAVVAGFPCQAYSTAARGRNRAGRDLWDEAARVIRQSEARLVFLENVPQVVKHRLPDILRDLADCGLDAEWGVLNSAALGDFDSRRRWFCLAANAHGEGEPSSAFDAEMAGIRPPSVPDRWPEPTGDIRGSDGLASRMDRCRMAGNGAKPIQAAVAFTVLSRRLGL